MRASEPTRTRKYARWAVAIVAAGVVLHILYLCSGYALNLTGDEAYYWEWSRRLDYGYYSKPPLVAWLIRASCELFGNVMPAIRLPAVLLGGGSLALGYWLCRRLYGSDRMALCTMGIMCAMPMLMAGSVLMTIDAPLFFLLSVATVGAALAILENRKWGWVLASCALCVAMTAKPAAAMWLIGPLIFLLLSRRHRRQLRTPWPYLTALGCGLGLVPLVLWNTHHGWVMARHVAHDLGDAQRSIIREFANYVSGQLAVASPPIMIAIVIGARLALRRTTGNEADRERFLLAMGAPYLIFPAFVTLWSKAQPNWTAPGYFTLAILATHYLAGVRHTSNGRLLVHSTIVFAAIALLFSHFGQLVYHAAAASRTAFGAAIPPAKIDVGRRGRGWDALGQGLGDLVKELPSGTIIMAADYQTTALATFYTAGNPSVYRYGTCLTPPTQHWSQYELWPDRLPISPELEGRDALVVQTRESAQMSPFFSSFRLERTIPVTIAGEEVRTFYLYHGVGFRGMKLNGGEATY